MKLELVGFEQIRLTSQSVEDEQFLSRLLVEGVGIDSVKSELMSKDLGFGTRIEDKSSLVVELCAKNGT
jgi:hypothetical protein